MGQVPGIRKTDHYIRDSFLKLLHVACDYNNIGTLFGKLSPYTQTEPFGASSYEYSLSVWNQPLVFACIAYVAESALPCPSLEIHSWRP